MRHETIPSFEDRIASLFQSDPLLPSQYLQTFQRRTYLQPEKGLMMAVLEDAILCFQKYLFARNRKGQTLFREAEEWIFTDGESDALFSFASICEFLGANPDCIRCGLMQWKEKTAARPLRAGGSKKMNRKKMQSAA